ncbi:hypothetical protein DFP72DRAFT_847513 [Ephemerocybe angulata]|uniref:Uncharacterized protein n=1 Tax=Ephemerocybe angulata TaxID=980116 RepID=A0A8H6HY29_9AGAR|nr:hypothetical protein DFP72DRAFT_847513 [Tulosesus angulatus]
MVKIASSISLVLALLPSLLVIARPINVPINDLSLERRQLTITASTVTATADPSFPTEVVTVDEETITLTASPTDGPAETIIEATAAPTVTAVPGGEDEVITVTGTVSETVIEATPVPAITVTATPVRRGLCKSAWFKREPHSGLPQQDVRMYVLCPGYSGTTALTGIFLPLDQITSATELWRLLSSGLTRICLDIFSLGPSQLGQLGTTWIPPNRAKLT